ncbi:unnamed protein product [Strongylus vulgaris]|uniref:Uncharacterized protein n=1 Tax=Strongylus vulgaris TaxID=40348 RepID=A0A3P7JA16_STRVU|nr:unnamed protein product [Strongylus vulgaris]
MSEMTVVEQNTMKTFEMNYEKLKDILEHRMRIGSNFVQVHKFAKDLESSFDALTSLLDTNRDFANERVAAQVNNVFHMIEETMTQEKHDVERFVNGAESVARNDETLDVHRSVKSAKNMIIDHDHRYIYLKSKWDEWQRNKARLLMKYRKSNLSFAFQIELKKHVRIIEEIEMWQEDTWEIISSNQKQKRKYSSVLLSFITTTFPVEPPTPKGTVSCLETFCVSDEEYNRRVEEVLRRQKEIEERYKKLKKKDGIDVKNNIDYRQEYINGVASLVIEETFIEDTATYTVRAENIGGVAESSAKLTVKCESYKELKWFLNHNFFLTHRTILERCNAA